MDRSHQQARGQTKPIRRGTVRGCWWLAWAPLAVGGHLASGIVTITACPCHFGSTVAACFGVTRETWPGLLSLQTWGRRRTRAPWESKTSSRQVCKRHIVGMSAQVLHGIFSTHDQRSLRIWSSFDSQASPMRWLPTSCGSTLNASMRCAASVAKGYTAATCNFPRHHLVS